ncbi:MAG: methylmalonyl Co-A mutase-associated GTPase MeaB [Alphaproteobacteria bacterium]|nr:methylmalonyl Co-A mutase-associated GTPase MeaB [Alphaproteobacteria bacterium]
MTADIRTLAEKVSGGDRRALARAITLIESTRSDHREQAVELLECLPPPGNTTVRLGITGIPGAGKSTFIEAFGLYLTGLGHRVAVLAVDPSSPRSGGSILGDKTRMEELSRHPDSFIRPSPSGGTLGGVARRTREALQVCEAAGFDVVIVETVGVGQSETAVFEMVDMFLLLLVPGGGDDLQGIKKGVVELADLLLINKTDGDLVAAASRAERDYASALHLLMPIHPGWTPPVIKVSALEGRGMDEVWAAVEAYRAALGSEALAAKRANQSVSWMWRAIEGELMDRFKAHPAIAPCLSEQEALVARGKSSPTLAAGELIKLFFAHGPS